MVYDHLLNNLNAIASSVQNGTNATLRLGHDLHVYCTQPQNKHDECEGCSHCLGGAFEIDDSKPWARRRIIPGHTVSVPIAAETEEDKNKDGEPKWESLMCSGNSLITNNPHRMFSFGIMIHMNHLTVVYFSPTHCARSTEVDIKKNYYSVLSVCLSFLLASPSAMGFDPTIHRFEDSCSPFFVYEMLVQLSNNETDEPRTQFFQMVKHMYQHQSLRAHPCITSVPSGGRLRPTMALKNTWLPVGMTPEKEVLDQISTDIEAFAERLEVEGEPGYFRELDDGTKEMVYKCLKDGSYKDYFVTIVCQHIGEASKPVSNKPNHEGRPRGKNYWYYEYPEEEEAFGEPRQHQLHGYVRRNNPADHMISWGFVFAAFVPLVLFWIFGNDHLRAIWRLSLGLGTVPAMLVFLWRLSMEEPTRYKKDSMKRAKIPYRLVFRRYWVSLSAVSAICITGGNESLAVIFGWNVVLNLVSLPGAMGGAFLLDYLGPGWTLISALLVQAVVGFLMSALYKPLTNHIAAFTVNNMTSS
ncbi:hypothetical protein P691DRAFT_779911, partial [Macrolepiota fuliginosa MF-IS2]